MDTLTDTPTDTLMDIPTGTPMGTLMDNPMATATDTLIASRKTMRRERHEARTPCADTITSTGM